MLEKEFVLVELNLLTPDTSLIAPSRGMVTLLFTVSDEAPG